MRYEKLFIEKAIPQVRLTDTGMILVPLRLSRDVHPHEVDLFQERGLTADGKVLTAEAPTPGSMQELATKWKNLVAEVDSLSLEHVREQEAVALSREELLRQANAVAQYLSFQ